MEDLSAMVAGVRSDDPLLQLESTTKFRKFLSSNLPTSTADEVIQSGVVPRFVEFLKKQDSPKLQCEAAWILKDIASVKPEVVIDHNAVPILVELLASPHDDVLEQACWVLSNVAGSSVQNRDNVLNCGALIPLCSQLDKDTTKLSMLTLGTWTLLNFCCGTPRPLFNQVKPALPTLERLLHSNDDEVLSFACSALWYMFYDSDDGIQSLIEAGFVPILVQLLEHTSPYVYDSVRGLICHILSEDTQQIQYVIDGGALPILANLLTQDNEKTIKEACWMITNICVGTEEQIQSVIDANLIPILVNVAHNTEMDVKMKAAWAITNALSNGSDAQLKYLVEQNCIKPLCDVLECPDLRVISVCLDGLGNILMTGEAEKENTGGVNYYSLLIEDAQGLAKIENLQSHEKNEIKKKAVKILATYWPSRRR